jgi:hypothetical protein
VAILAATGHPFFIYYDDFDILAKNVVMTNDFLKLGSYATSHMICVWSKGIYGTMTIDTARVGEDWHHFRKFLDRILLLLVGEWADSGICFDLCQWLRLPSCEGTRCVKSPGKCKTDQESPTEQDKTLFAVHEFLRMLPFMPCLTFLFFL